MKGRAFFAIIVLTGLFLAAGTSLAGEPVKITGRVLGHVLAGDDDRLYEMVPSPKSEALMDLAGRRVTISGILLNDCDWTCIIEITDFSDLSDQTPPPQAVFVPARPKKEEPAWIEPEKTPEPAPAPVVAAPAPSAPVVAEPAPPAPEPVAAAPVAPVPVIEAPAPPATVVAEPAPPEPEPVAAEPAPPAPVAEAEPVLPPGDPSKFRAR